MSREMFEDILLPNASYKGSHWLNKEVLRDLAQAISNTDT